MPEAKMPFDEELAWFRQRLPGDPGYRGLILLGTGQHTTAALLLATLKLERAAFLLTDQAKLFPGRVAELLDRPLTAPQIAQLETATPGQRVTLGTFAGALWECYLLEHASELDVYKVLKDLLNHWTDVDRTTLVADVTGGTKPMTVGLAKAAYVLNLPTIYVASEPKFDPARSSWAPQEGTQYLDKLENDPFVVFGDLEAAEAKRLFAAHDYSSAARIFADLARRVPPPANATYQAYATLARTYAAWDAFDLSGARAELDSLLAAPLPDALAAYATVLHGQAASLERLEVISGARETHSEGATSAKKKAPISLQVLQALGIMLPLLGSLYANGRRREAGGRYDMAALMLYRCLESIAQQRLATWEVLISSPDYAVARQRNPHLDARYALLAEAKTRDSTQILPADLPIAALQPQKNAPKPPREPITLFMGYKVLAALDDPLVRGYNIWQIEDRTRARNQSILAHGYRLITQEEYEQFCEIVEELLDRFFHILSQDRAAWETAYTFVCPFPAPGRADG